MSQPRYYRVDFEPEASALLRQYNKDCKTVFLDPKISALTVEAQMIANRASRKVTEDDVRKAWTKITNNDTQIRRLNLGADFAFSASGIVFGVLLQAGLSQPTIPSDSLLGLLGLGFLLLAIALALRFMISFR